MPSEQAKDVLKHCQAFHRKVSEYYQQLKDQVASERVKMLLEYLSRHEKHLAKTLGRYEKEASSKLLQTWLQFVDEHILKIFDEVEVKPDMTVEDVIKVGLQFDDALLKCFRNVVDNAETEEVRAAFQNLIEMEEQEKHQLVRNALRADDF